MPEHPTPQQAPHTAPVPEDRLDARPGLTLGLRRNLAALSLVGAALVALPVVQLLRYQTAELDALAAGRAKLDPVARAVQVQRGLLAHRDIAGRVLGGLATLEPERKQRQNDVQSSLAAMVVTLADGRWELAIGEADNLYQDWLQLVQQVVARSIDPGGSDRAHRLLVEQTLQVIDLVGTAVQSDRSDSADARIGVPAATLAVVHALPRLIWQTRLLTKGEALGGPITEASALQAHLGTLEAGMARTLGLLEGSRRSAGAAPTTEETLLRAGAAAGAATERYFSLLRGPEPSSAPTRAAGLVAVQAQTQLFDLAHGTATAALAAQTRSAVQHRALLLGALTGLSLLAVALITSLWRGLLGLQPSSPSAREASGSLTGHDQDERRLQTEHLLQRLRDAPVAAVTAAGPAPADTPASTAAAARPE